jgi:putative membrane protein
VVIRNLKEENPMNAIRTLRPALLFVSATVFLATVPAFACGDGGCACQIQAALDALNAQNALPTTSANYMFTDSSDLRALGDKEFVREFLEDGVTKVMLGQLAQKKSQSDDVKQFGQTMAEDNSQLNEQVLAKIAKLVGVEEPKGPSKKDKQLAASLEALSGPKFDEAYIKLMMKEHAQDLKAFTTEAHNTVDPVMKIAAELGINVISMHLGSIQQVAQSHNAASQDHNIVALNHTPVMESK